MLFKKLFIETKFLVQPEKNSTCESSFSKGQELTCDEDVTADWASRSCDPTTASALIEVYTDCKDVHFCAQFEV